MSSKEIPGRLVPFDPILECEIMKALHQIMSSRQIARDQNLLIFHSSAALCS